MLAPPASSNSARWRSTCRQIEHCPFGDRRAAIGYLLVLVREGWKSRSARWTALAIVSGLEFCTSSVMFAGSQAPPPFSSDRNLPPDIYCGEGTPGLSEGITFGASP